MSCQAVLVVQPTWALRGKLLSQVEHRVWKAPLQRLCVLLCVAPSQAPQELLIVVDGFVQLLHWSPWGIGWLCLAGNRELGWTIHLGRGSSTRGKGPRADRGDSSEFPFPLSSYPSKLQCWAHMVAPYTQDASPRHRGEPSLLPKLEPSPVSVMLTPPSPICSPTSTVTQLGLKALYVVLVLI